MSKVFWTLFKARMQALFQGMFQIGGNKKKSALTKVGVAVLFLYIAVVFFGMFYMLFDSLCEAYHMLGLDWLYFSMMALFMVAIMFFCSVFKTQAELFDAKDNEFLLAMPIKPSVILASRQAVLYLDNLMFGLLAAVPAEAAYLIHLGFSLSQMAGWLVLMLVLPFFAMTLSTLIGWLVHCLTARMRNKSFLTVAASMTFLVLYFLGYSKIQEYMMFLLTKGELIAGVIRDNVLPIYWVGSSAVGENAGYLLVTLLLCVLPFAASYMVLSHFLYRILTTKQAGSKVVYKRRSMKEGSPAKGLFVKEWKYLLSQPMYIMNGSIGSLMLVIMIIAAIWKREDILMILQMLPDGASYLAPILILAIGAVGATNTLSASSISLEGKRMGILKSFPVEAKQILMAKLSLHLAVTMPFVLAAAVGACIVFPIRGVESIAVIAGSSALAFLSAIFGLWMNLLMPDFTWDSEIRVIKQSAAVFFTMFVPMGLAMAIALLYYFVVRKVMDVSVYMWIWIGVLVLADAVMAGFLFTKGCKIFDEL